MSWDLKNLKFWEKKAGVEGDDKKPDEKKLKGFQRKLMSFLKSPQGAEAAKKIQALVDRMKKEGIDVEDEKQVKAWIEKHKDEFKNEQAEAAPQAPFVNAKELPGRNDPCLCGSGKKFKKCCESKQTAA
jgi:uncharacterized protein YecA (UPF0149 family)